ncbi:MAG: sensor domain-containing diguanylate cyclase [Spirochaetales bacterium]|nr:MAG: sensor domain-containing diguanylate cyclase [Spirochaetales bacterium]
MRTANHPRRVSDHQHHIVMVVTVLFALAFSAAALSSWWVAASALTTSLNTRLKDTATAKAVAVDRYLERLRAVVRSYVRVMERTIPATEVVTADMLGSFRDEAGVDALYFGGSDGLFVGDLGWTPAPDYDPRTRPWYRAAMTQLESTAYSGVYLDLISGGQAVSFSSLVHNPDGSERGVLSVDIYLSTLTDEVRRYAYDSSGYVFLLDQEGTILVHPSQDIVGRNLWNATENANIADEVMFGDGTIIEYGDERGTFAVAAKLPTSGWVLGMVLERREAYSKLYDLAWTHGLILILSLVAVLVASRILARRLSDFATVLEAILDERNAQLRAKMEEIERISVTDSLTGIANRRALDAALSAEVLRARRAGTSLAALMLDIDHFKDINDLHGHVTGDKALVTLTRLASQTVRDTDRVGRWGGEEFVVLCPETGAEGASILAEKLRTRIAKGSAESGLPMTCSVGWAVLAKDDTPTRLISRADSGMYLAKRRGRNRVETMEDIDPAPGLGNQTDGDAGIAPAVPKPGQ